MPQKQFDRNRFRSRHDAFGNSQMASIKSQEVEQIAIFHRLAGQRISTGPELLRELQIFVTHIRQPGRIVELNVQEGSVVKKGDIVARLFADDFRAAYEQAKSAADAAGSEWLRAKANQEVAAAQWTEAKRAYDRAVALRDEGAEQAKFAQSELERVRALAQAGIEGDRAEQLAERDRDAARARLQSLEAGVAAAEAATSTADLPFGDPRAEKGLPPLLTTVVDAGLVRLMAGLKVHCRSSSISFCFFSTSSSSFSTCSSSSVIFSTASVRCGAGGGQQRRMSGRMQVGRRGPIV